MPRRAAFVPVTPSTASVLRVLASLESRGSADPGSVAFRLALARLGREARAAGGAAAVSTLIREAAAADPSRAGARAATLRAAWGEPETRSAA